MPLTTVETGERIAADLRGAPVQALGARPASTFNDTIVNSRKLRCGQDCVQEGEKEILKRQKPAQKNKDTDDELPDGWMMEQKSHRTLYGQE